MANLSARTVCLAAFLLTLGCAAPAARPPAGAPKSLPQPVQPQAQPQAKAPCDPSANELPTSGEGMWPWHDLASLDEALLRARGLQVPLSELWTPGKGGLLRAVAGMKGCSASFVSPDGLLLTNHHCAHRAIQRNSSPEHDYLENGFVARSRADELPGHGTLVYVFQQQTDVTSKVLDGLAESLSDVERLRELDRRESLIVKACEAKPNTRCQVARENHGLRFLLLENLELRDVRVVAAPPESLGNYGGEIDNWHWPRHTLDFTLMRAYVGPKGEPADYHVDNVPFRPERHLRVSDEFPAPPSFVMVAGTPGQTRRYATSTEVHDALTWYYPTRDELFTVWLEALERAAGAEAAAKLAIASWVRRLNNGLFHARGMSTGLRANATVARAEQRETALRAWIAAEPQRVSQFGTAVDDLRKHLEASRQGRERDLLLGYLTSGAQVFASARRITKWASERSKADEAREPGYQDRDADTLRRELEQAQKSLHLEADRAVMKVFVKRLCRLPQAERPAILSEPKGLPCDDGLLERKLTDLYRRSRLTEAAGRTKAFGASLETLKQSTDPMIQLALQMGAELDAADERGKQQAGARLRVERPYLQALIAFQGKAFYPDANSTPRVSFAHVAGYGPRDGAWHVPRTTFGGMLEKHTGKEPFAVPELLRRAYEQRPQAGDDEPLCFLSNADTTGGNSGSPVLDGQGRMLGLNFDRVYENIAGDYGYSRQRSRNVVVSTRAILWYLEQVAGAAAVAAELRGAK
jgi:hypothetical protein